MIKKTGKDEDQNFIDLGLQYRYINDEQIRECRETQQKRPVKSSLIEIALSHDFIDRNQYKVLKTIIKYKTLPSTPNKEFSKKDKKRDREFVEILLQEKFISYDQLKKCLELQKALVEYARIVPIANVIISQGLLWENADWENWNETLKEKSTSKILILSLKNDSLGKVYLINKKEISITLAGKDEVSLGRVVGADIQVNDNGVSRIHCKVRYVDYEKTWELIDMMSTYGTYLNEERISKTLLQSSDVIRIGQSLYQVMICRD